ncbi:cobalamin-dependent protein [Ilumatobacter sp.]|uniref:cobalamin-dependent protein n=1 Tax=Ilumatobacter sp. TaxID=1967498 RepID=UPI003B52A4E5
MSDTYTLREAADVLGVHYMTVYRYVRLGLLDASKAGTTWQVTDVALERFRAGTGSGPVRRGDHAPWAERLEGRLVEGDGTGAWRVVEAAMASGTDVRAVYLEMLAPSMVSIGERWAAGEFDISIEHQATVIVTRIIGRLGPRFSRRGRSCGGLVVGSPVGEYHGLPTAILADLMREQGWEVNDLGPNTPASSFLHAARRMSDLRAVGISVTNPELVGPVGECSELLKRDDPEVVVVVGGQAFRDVEHARSLGADELAVSADQLHELLMGRADRT